MSYALLAGARDTDTSDWLYGAVSRVYYNDGTTDIDIPVDHDEDYWAVYMCPENTTVHIVYSKDNYQGGTDDFTVTSDRITHVKFMVTTYRRFRWQQVGDSLTTDKNPTGIRCELHLASDDSVESTCIPDNRGNYGSDGTWFYFPVRYRMAAEYITGESLYTDPVYLDKWSRRSENFGSTPPYWPLGITWAKNLLAINPPTAVDAITGNDISNRVQKYVYVTYEGDATSYNPGYNTTAAKWFAFRDPSGTSYSTELKHATVHVELDGSQAGYETKTFTYDVPADTPVELIDPANLPLMPLPAFQITVVDSDTGLDVSNFTATVTKDGAVIEQSTDGKFYVAWDGTSTYTLTVVATGYDTFAGDYVTYPTGVSMRPEAQYSKLYVNVTDRGTPIAADVVVQELGGAVVPETDGYYSLCYNRQKTYSVTVSKTDYETFTTTVTPTSVDQTLNVALVKIFRYAQLTVTVTDSRHGTAISDATVTVYNDTDSSVVPLTDGHYNLVCNDGKTFHVEVYKTGYVGYIGPDLTPVSETQLTDNVSLEKILSYARLFVNPTDAAGRPLTDATIMVYDDFTGDLVEKTGDYWPVIYNDNEPYTVYVTCNGYYDYTENLHPTASSDITLSPQLEKIPVYAPLYVTAVDAATQEEIPDATIQVYNETTGDYVDPAGDYWNLRAEMGYVYKIIITAPSYIDYESDGFTVNDDTPIYRTCNVEHVPEYAPLTVTVQDGDTLEPITTAKVTVYDEINRVRVPKDPDGSYYVMVGGTFTVTARAAGYDDKTTVPFTPASTASIIKTLKLYQKYPAFATVADFMALTGKTLTEAEIERVKVLLSAVSDLIRNEGKKVGIDVDAAIAVDEPYRSVVRMVTVDVTNRVLRQSQDGEPVSQYSESALGYSFSATSAIAGGGIAMSLMRNEKAILGFSRQKLEGVSMWKWPCTYTESM